MTKFVGTYELILREYNAKAKFLYILAQWLK